jgi:hypothetical protein
VLVSTNTKAGKAPTITQLSTQAITRLQEIVGRRDDPKLLTAALAEAAVEEAQHNVAFLRRVQILYDEHALAKRPASRRQSATKPRKELIPVISADEIGFDRDEKTSAYGLQKLYGNAQLRDALDGYTLATLKEMAATVMERNPGTAPSSKRTKAAVIDYIVQCLTG